MTIADHLVPRVQPPPDAGVIEVRWSRLVAAASRNGVEAPVGVGLNGSNGTNGATSHGYARLELVLHIEPRSDGQAIASSWLERDGSRRDVLARRSVACAHVRDADGVEHLDLFDGPRRLAALTLDPRGRVLYAQTPLLADAGLPGGTYDPPAGRRA